MGASRFRFCAPRKKEISEAPPRVTGTSTALVEDNRRHGIHASAATGDSGWDGFPIDYEHAMFVLLQPAVHAA